jgi:hypothetical protein
MVGVFQWFKLKCDAHLCLFIFQIHYPTLQRLYSSPHFDVILFQGPLLHDTAHGLMSCGCKICTNSLYLEFGDFRCGGHTRIYGLFIRFIFKNLKCVRKQYKDRCINVLLNTDLESALPTTWMLILDDEGILVGSLYAGVEARIEKVCLFFT